MIKDILHIQKAMLALLCMQRHSWEQGVTMQACLELGDEAAVLALAKEAAYRSVEDGRTATIGFMLAATDPCCTGEALLWAARKTQDPQLVGAYEKLLDWALHTAPRSSEGIVYHMTDKKEFWIDSAYMLPPFLAAAGYFDEAVQQMNGNYRKLIDPQSGLLSHMWDDEKQVFVRQAHWGVGNGWAMAGMARVIAMLPDTMQTERSEMIRKCRGLIDAVRQYMRPDGLFHDVIDDPASFVEVNLSQMLCYTILRGLCDGWLQEKEYAGICAKLRNAALQKQDAYGLVQDVCGAPSFDKPGVAPEGQAFFLLMEAQWHKYQNKVAK